MIKSQAFPNIQAKINLLLPIVEEYIFFDVVKAIYCINLCINNRSILESCLALNACLVEHSGMGTKTIKSYDEFLNFIGLIKNTMQPSSTDDETVEDFGDVQIQYDGKYYRAIIGTGHNNVFACYNFLPALARETHNEQVLTSALEYVSNTIDYFKKTNTNDGLTKKRFSIPSRDLFFKVNEYFKSEFVKFDIEEIITVLGDDELLIEKSHFVEKDDNLYPLYNVSLLVDLFDKWISPLNLQHRISVANNGIVDRICSLFEADREKLCRMYVPARIFTNQKPDSSQKTYTFVARTENGLIVAMNKDEYPEDMLEQEIQHIESLHDNNALSIGEVSNRFGNDGYRGFSIDSSIPVIYLIYDSFTNPNESYFSFGETGITSRKTVTALDVIYYLDFMDNLEELYDYLSSSNENHYERRFGFGSDASLFFTWKDNERYIAKGAIVYNLLDTGYDTENEYVVDYYRTVLKDYPFHLNDYLFREPFSWNIESLENFGYSIYSKDTLGFGGNYYPLPNGNYLFLVNNITFYKNVMESFGEYRQQIQLYNEIIEEFLLSCENCFTEAGFKNIGIQVMFMPAEYAKTAGHEVFLTEERQFVYSDAQYYNRKWIIRYVTKDIHKLYSQIQSATDRSIEVAYIEELFKPLSDQAPRFNRALHKHLDTICPQKKMVDVFTMSVDYQWDNNVTTYTPSDYDFHEVRKRIAKVCCNNGITPGEYLGKDANAIIRSMQKTIIEDFETEVVQYNQEKLHHAILDFHSTLVHEINLNWHRYGSYHNLDEGKEAEIRERIITQRENAKHDDRNALYLLETNLYLNRNSSLVATTDNINFLLAYANWLVVLSDVADMCHFAESDAHIEIEEDFVVDTISDEKADQAPFIGYNHRIYEHSQGLKRNSDIDNRYLSSVKDTFYQDTGINFENFLDLLTYLSSYFSKEIIKHCGSNVMVSDIDTLSNDFIEHMGGKITKETTLSLFNSITICSQSLKTSNGKSDFYLPIGQRRLRENRFEVKPLVLWGTEIIFSPVTIDHLLKDWLNGIMDWLLPYEIGMNKTKELLVKWKREYEKQIVKDIKNLFEQQQCAFVRMDFELRKLNKEHPQYLGDYDVFAIDACRKIIWIIECKVIEKVATYYDMFRQQNRFFNEHKEDEKFQRRIDYLNEHKEKILKQLGFSSDNEEEYTVLPYMCMNKVLVSRYKKLDFPIVSYTELELLIKQNS